MTACNQRADAVRSRYSCFLAVLALVAVTANDASAQQNQAQQVAYARAFTGAWYYPNGGSSITLNKDGAELRATLAGPSQAMVGAGQTVGKESMKARFNGPEVTGLVLSSGLLDSWPNYRRLCNTTTYWRPLHGRMTFERNRIDITYQAFVIAVENGRCVVVEQSRDKAKLDRLLQNPFALAGFQTGPINGTINKQ